MRPLDYLDLKNQFFIRPGRIPLLNSIIFGLIYQRLQCLWRYLWRKTRIWDHLRKRPNNCNISWVIDISNVKLLLKVLSHISKLLKLVPLNRKQCLRNIDDQGVFSTVIFLMSYYLWISVSGLIGLKYSHWFRACRLVVDHFMSGQLI